MNDVDNGTNEGSRAITVRPQAGNMIGIAAAQQRETAEIQSALTVAAARPRDELAAIDRIKTACQRQTLAEIAEYNYKRGGTEITGGSIDLLTVIANYWGNINYGFRLVAQTPEESLVEASAWDLETNTKAFRSFSVSHKRVTDKGSRVTLLTDPRDVYEHVANFSQRRVRACLEEVIPRDVVEDAISQCRATLNEKTPVTPERIKTMLDGFTYYKVTKEHIEARLGRRLDAVQPAQLAGLARIYKSLKDGMSKPGDWFEMEEAKDLPASTAEAAKQALKNRKAAEPEPAPAEPATPTTPATPTAAPAKPKGKAGKTASVQERIKDAFAQLKLNPNEIAGFLFHFNASEVGHLTEPQAEQLLERLTLELEEEAEKK